MSGCKGSIPISAMIIVLVVFGVFIVFARSFAVEKTSGENIYKIKYAHYTINNGMMLEALMNKGNGLVFPEIISSTGSKGFPLESRNAIISALKNIESETGKTCFLVVKTPEGAYEYNMPKESPEMPKRKDNAKRVFSFPPIESDDGLCVTSSYGWRKGRENIGSRKIWNFHKGIDFRGSKKAVHAPLSGFVDYIYEGCPWSDSSVCADPSKKGTPEYQKTCGCNNGYGNVVSIRHPEGFYTFYYHLDSVLVKPGQFVSAGERIGISGNSGHSTGPHLHFSVSKVPFTNIAERVNPENYLNPCAMFENDIMLMMLEKMGAAGCLSCEAKCTDSGLDAEDPYDVPLCISASLASEESMEIPLPGGETGHAELTCY